MGALWQDIKCLKIAAFCLAKINCFFIRTFKWDTMHLWILGGCKTASDQIQIETLGWKWWEENFWQNTILLILVKWLESTSPWNCLGLTLGRWWNSKYGFKNVAWPLLTQHHTSGTIYQCDEKLKRAGRLKDRRTCSLKYLFR